MELDTAIQQMNDDIQKETKSTAGDKYETGRAMIHIELEKIWERKKDLMNRIKIFESIGIHPASKIVIPGSLIQTNYGWIYLIMAMGKCQFEQQDIMVISSASPLGNLLKGKCKGDMIQRPDKTYEILDIY